MLYDPILAAQNRKEANLHCNFINKGIHHPGNKPVTSE